MISLFYGLNCRDLQQQTKNNQVGIISEGILWGLVLSILAGPIFIALIQLGIERGIRAGMSLSIGVLFSDLIYIVLVYMGMSQFEESSSFKLYGSIIGGIILILFGIGSMISKYQPETDIKISAKNYAGYFMKGVMINVSNPFVLFLWIAVTKKMFQEDLEFPMRVTFIAALLFTVAATDLAKLVLAKRIRNFMKPHHFTWMRRIAGAALVIFGILLMVRGYVES